MHDSVLRPACRMLAGHIARLARKREKQAAELAEAERAGWYRQAGDSLMALPRPLPRGTREAILLNVHTRSQETVPLNPALDSRKNAELYYRKARKAARGLEISSRKVSDTEKEISVCRELAAECTAVLTGGRVEDDNGLAGRIAVALGTKPPGAGRDRGYQGQKLHFRSFHIDGWQVFIGKNGAENDELSTRFAKHTDLWLHVAGHAGSHVVVSRPERNVPVPPAVIEKAAALAVWFSKAKHTSRAEVHYTEARFVHKHRRSPPGEVVLDRYKTIRVAPCSPHDLFPSRYQGEER